MLFNYIINFILFLLPFIFLLLTIALSTLLERKIMGSMQRRRGPNIAGLFGFLQPIADGLKLFLKEIIIPTNSNTFLYLLAPVFTFFSSILLWLVIPFNKNIVLLNTSFSMLYLLVVSSLSVYGIIFAGWSSNSKYAFLGGLRSSAQMISYEVSISFIWICVSVISNSLNLVDIVNKQEDSIWFIIPLFPLWIIFVIIMLAETNRAPFDLPEAEAELVAGYNVEYSGIAFALFFLAEYGSMALMSSISTLFFFGGWLPLYNINNTYFSFLSNNYIWFGIKVALHLFLFVWVRATLPRYRYDQLQKLSWKRILPITVLFTVLVIVFKLAMFNLMFFFYYNLITAYYIFVVMFLSFVEDEDRKY